MNNIDVGVLIAYLIGLVIMGTLFSRMSSTKDMFNAGGQSPWWLSGLSAFMTTFSAGTFVVWGGIAYSDGAVAISILVSIGISSLLVGRFLAARWKSFGYDSAAEFLTDRFGRSIVQFYTLVQGLVGIFTMGGAIYALAVIIAALMPLPADHLLADPETGFLSVNIASFLICILVILITSGGGLWAVLMTDALQFIILFVSVIAVVPLLLIEVGGMDTLVNQAPANFFTPISEEFSIVFLIGWIIIYFFKLGGEWGYIQRFSCVPTAKDAKKSSYLFGVLYLISPFIWMLPPMLFRIHDDSVNPEQAYILACQLVLPAGMLGLMIAAMCSATASTVTTYLNVFAGAFTTEFYQGIFRKNASEKELVFVGRIFTILLGGIAMAGAFIIPAWGTYTGYVISSVAILSGPLVLPTIWGIFSSKLNLKGAWSVTFISIVAVIILKFGFQSNGWFTDIERLSSLSIYLQQNVRIFELAIGILIPMILLVGFEWSHHSVDVGWEVIQRNKNSKADDVVAVASDFPIRLCAISVLIVGIVMLLLGFLQTEHKVFVMGFGASLVLLGSALYLFYKRMLSKQIRS